MAEVVCAKCGARYPLEPQMRGRRVKCRACGHEFQIPGEPAGLEILDDQPQAPQADQQAQLQHPPQPQAQPQPAPQPLTWAFWETCSAISTRSLKLRNKK